MKNGKLIQGMKLRKRFKFESIILKQAQEKTRKTTNVQVYELGQANHCASPRTISVTQALSLHKLKIQCVPC
jgi:hypothetical protein